MQTMRVVADVFKSLWGVYSVFASLMGLASLIGLGYGLGLVISDSGWVVAATTISFPVAVVAAFRWAGGSDEKQPDVARILGGFDERILAVPLQPEGAYPAATFVLFGSVTAVLGISHWTARWLRPVRRRALQTVVAERNWVAKQAIVDPSRIVVVLVVPKWTRAETAETVDSTVVSIADSDSAAEILKRNQHAAQTDTSRQLALRFSPDQ
jgi:hypothetical protein